MQLWQLWSNLVVLKFKIITIKYNRGLPSSHFGIWGHRADLGDRGHFRFWKCKFGIYEPIWLFLSSKCSQWNIKGGYLSPIYDLVILDFKIVILYRLYTILIALSSLHGHSGVYIVHHPHPFEIIFFLAYKVVSILSLKQPNWFFQMPKLHFQTLKRPLSPRSVEF